MGNFNFFATHSNADRIHLFLMLAFALIGICLTIILVQWFTSNILGRDFRLFPRKYKKKYILDYYIQDHSEYNI